MNKAEVVRKLKEHHVALEALGVRRAYLFGSVAKGTEAPSSDVDLMVDLDEGPGGRKPLFSAFDVGRIQFELCRILGRRVDLVVRTDALKPGKRLRPVAESQLVDVF
ncbi:MAG: nucleotidyltransferase domain-containing protein [Alphaproteobacteria bacterium]